MKKEQCLWSLNLTMSLKCTTLLWTINKSEETTLLTPAESKQQIKFGVIRSVFQGGPLYEEDHPGQCHN